jgi:hypothetical protein
MLVGQAALLGIALAILATLIHWVVARPASWTIVTSPTATAQRQSTARPDSIAMPPLVATASTAPTIAVRVPDSQ